MFSFSPAKPPQQWCSQAAAVASLVWLLSLPLTVYLLHTLRIAATPTAQLWLGILPLHGLALLAAVRALQLKTLPGQRLAAADALPPTSWKQAGRQVLAHLPLVYAAGMLATAITLWLLALLGIARQGSPVIQMLLANDSLWFWLSAAVIIVVVAPLAEEFLFRMVLFDALFNLAGNAATAAVVTSLIFASVHGIAEQVPALFILALVLQYLRARWQSLWPAVALHALFNSVSLAMLVIARLLQLPPQP